jgi:hypothetical protein
MREDKQWDALEQRGRVWFRENTGLNQRLPEAKVMSLHDRLEQFDDINARLCQVGERLAFLHERLLGEQQFSEGSQECAVTAGLPSAFGQRIDWANQHLDQIEEAIARLTDAIG